MNEPTVKGAKGSVLTAISSDTQHITEVSEEFSLPDYVPEVRRILHTRTAVLPEGKFLSDKDDGTSVDFNGTVTYNVIYTDDDGNLRSVPLSSSYEDSFTLSCHPTTVFIDTSPDNVTCRATAPRKLAIKTRFKSRFLAFSDETIEANITPRSLSDEMFIERKTKKVDSVSLNSLSMQNIKLSDKLDAADGAEITPIMCDASISITDCKVKNGGVSARGSATVKCLCQSEGKDIVLTKSVPIYEELSADGAVPGDMARCFGRCVSLSVSNDTGSTSSLYFDLDCEIEGEYYKNEENMLTEDCYSTRWETDTDYRNADIYSLVSAKNQVISLSDKFKRKDPEIESISDIICDVFAERTDTVNGKVGLSGRLNVTVIGKTRDKDGKAGEYVSESYDAPFRFDIPVDSEFVTPRACFSCSSPVARYENDKFCINADIICSYALIKKDSVRLLNGATLKKDSEYKRDSSCVRVFFPKDCDILWEVAKRFHTTERKIMEENSLTSKSLDGVKSIII